ncbi:glycerophosphodiester phosphodiesterase family protein [Haliangium ochraceum]|uniref:glycerophosphodiester phosphodiesterase n=1 Tax=Haliangium ochraceum (strain DSM 14365 / JCM 11303 / SMP-2) TaxID=502025 RepID=D0LU08_HALO1|nr:glycerophosphodiester phosphodiesterase family protein [Haliangium ochraceum]ACY17372.1 glycerophosphoryl diester phosphodiesterase [Haliangium ochraceum DSM 14365]
MMSIHAKLTAVLSLAALAAGCGDDYPPAMGPDANALTPPSATQNVHLGPRPFYLVEDMSEGALKDALAACQSGPFYKSEFSIGHRGAPMQFPEHTRESYEAAARMGAGVLECDVAFTADRELVCRHSQCDLHTTTNILAIPELAAKCTQPFTPAAGDTDASAMCCTSDITLAEFKSLCGKMDASDPAATTVEEYLGGTAPWRTDLYATCGTVLSHAESIKLFQSLEVKMTPELKTPSVEMPFEGEYTQEMYAQQMIDEYKQAGVPASDVFAQSFLIDDVRYWIANEPAFGNQAVYLDDRNERPGFDIDDPASWSPSMEELAAEGVKIIAPPLWFLVTLEDGAIVPSDYAKMAKAAGLDIITWTLERSGPLSERGGWYYQSVTEAIDNDGDMMVLLDVLAKDVGVRGVFSDWPATTTYYANCMDL